MNICGRFSLWVFALFLLEPLFPESSGPYPWLRLEAENFDTVDAERRNFGGVVGVFFPKKESSIRTTFHLPKAADTQVWARVYFPWARQDAISLSIDNQAFPVTARIAASAGRWDLGNYQVWHWVKAATLRLDAGNHQAQFQPQNGNEQRVDQLILYWGEKPAWTQEWLSGGLNLPARIPEWKKGNTFTIPAQEFWEIEADLQRLGQATVAELRKDEDRLRAVVQTNKPLTARLWARVYFEAKNMFEGLTMEEMSNNLYLSVDGELQKTVFEQNARQWEWISTDQPFELLPGPHLLTVQKQGLPIKVEQVVLHAGDDATQAEWFRAPAPPVLPSSLLDARPDGPSVGGWRLCSGYESPRMTFLGEKDGPAKFPIIIDMGNKPSAVTLLRVAGLQFNGADGDTLPAQQFSAWVKNSGTPLKVEILYTDRHGEAFLQEMNDGSAWTGWRLLSANLPLRVRGREAYFDSTGYAIEVAFTPKVVEGGRPLAGLGVRSSGGDANATPDFPIEARALRFIKESTEPVEIVFGEPFRESPFNLRASLRTQPDAESAGGSVTCDVEVANSQDTEKNAWVYYRFGDFMSEPIEPGARQALLRVERVKIPGRGSATLALRHRETQPGFYLFECQAGQGQSVRRTFAFGKPWELKRAAWLKESEGKAGAFHFSPEGRDQPLKMANGSLLPREQVAAAYGLEKGLVVTDDGADVCSLAYAAKRDFAFPLTPAGMDLSDEAGWPHVSVPQGTLAIDPFLGRCKFAEANPSRLELLSHLQTGFGVPGPPIRVRGNFAYVGPGEGHYSIVDVSDRARPRVVSSISSWYFSHNLFLSGPFGYFESSHRGLILVDDLSNPYQPGALRNVHFSRSQYGRLTHLFDGAAVAYSISPEPALWAFDLSNPLYPRELAKVAGLSSFVPAGTRSAFAYLKDSIRLLDISDPRQPKLLPGELPREKNEKGEAISGIFAASEQHLAVRSGNRMDLYSYRVKGSLAAEKLCSLTVPEKSGNHIFGTFHRGLLYLLDGRDGPGQYSIGAHGARSRWFVFEFEKGKASQAGFYEHPWASAFGNITVAGETAYVSDYNYGMWTFDVSQPRSPSRVGGVATAGESDGIWLDGGLAYQWQTFGGAVFLIDVSRPEAPRRLGEYWDGAWLPYGNTRRGNYTIAGRNGFCYVPRQGRGLVIADVREPEAPRGAGEFRDDKDQPIMPNGACIDVWGERAAVLLNDKLLIYQVTEPSKPALLSTLSVTASDTLSVKGDRAFLGSAQGSFTIVDITDAAKPAVLSTLDLKPYCYAPVQEVISGIAVAKGYAYLTTRGIRGDGAMFLHIVDVRNPRQPQWVTTYDPRPDLPASPCSLWGDFYQDLIVDGDYLFIGNYGQIECYDISKPDSPRFFDTKHIGYQWSVGRKRGDYLFVPALSGLIVLRAPSSSQAPVGNLEFQARF